MISLFRESRLLLLVLLLAATALRAEDVFPVPEELEPDVQFWVDVFSRYGNDEGVLHDNRRLDIVYEVMPMPEGLSRRERRQRINARRDHYRGILRQLAAGKHDNLQGDAARVLALWGENTDVAEFAAAARRIRFQQGLSGRFRDGLERSGRWRPHVRNSFARLGVPLELAALPHVESSYNPAARSHVGASGIWQFTRSTGRRFMRVDHVVDERNDPFDATVAAGELLAYNYAITGSWPLAITAYNHGLAGVRRAIREFGKDDLTGILRNYRGRTFGFASRNFYVAFVAAMRIDTDPQSYFPGVTPEPPLDYEQVTLPRYVPARALAQALDTDLRTLRQHNPALRDIVWEGSKHVPRDYRLRLPRGLLGQPLDQLVAAVPAAAWQDEQLPDLFHTVRRGDTLSAIAQTYRTRVSTLVALNDLGSRHRIRIGQKLRLPAAGPAPAVAAAAPAAPPAETAAESLPGAEAAEEIAAADAMPAAATAAEPDDGPAAPSALPSAPGEGLLSDPSDYSVAADGTIEVQSLETLGHYADWLEIRTQRLRDLNGLAFRTPVTLGQRLKLDLGRVDAATFEARRTAYQRTQQDDFFSRHTIRGTTTHRVRRGESAWVIALRRYDVPLWLLRQYNPELDLDRVRPGTEVRIPLLDPVVD